VVSVIQLVDLANDEELDICAQRTNVSVDRIVDWLELFVAHELVLIVCPEMLRFVKTSRQVVCQW